MKQNFNQLRRRLLLGAVTLPFSGLLRAMPATPAGFEGPFYPTSSMRFADDDNDLVKIEGVVKQAGGEIVILQGRVLDQAGKPLQGARVEIWQCDVNGRYLHKADFGWTRRDRGFQGFGHSIADKDGNYRFRTIKPVAYTGRTPHIHLKVLHEGVERLTTQLYLHNHPDNERDGLYRRIPVEQRELVSMRFDSSAEPVANLDLVV